MMNEYNDDTTISTAEYRITPGIYAREAVSHWTGRFWFIVALPLLALAAYGAWFDWRYIVVTACVMFILFPSFALAGFNIALTSRGARYALYPQQVTLSGSDILTVKFSPIPPRRTAPGKGHIPPGEEPSGSDTPSAEDAEETMPGTPAPTPLTFRPGQIESCARWKRHTVVNCAGGVRLIIPDQAFSTPAESLGFEERLMHITDGRKSL